MVLNDNVVDSLSSPITTIQPSTASASRAQPSRVYASICCPEMEFSHRHATPRFSCRSSVHPVAGPAFAQEPPAQAIRALQTSRTDLLSISTPGRLSTSRTVLRFWFAHSTHAFSMIFLSSLHCCYILSVTFAICFRHKYFPTENCAH